MKGSCGICRRTDRAAIDAALLLGRPLRVVAQEFGVSRSTLHRHSRHVHDVTMRAMQRVTVAYSRALRQSMARVQKVALEIMEAAKLAGDRELALRAVAEARANAECMRKLLIKTADPRAKAKTAETPALKEYLRHKGEAA